MRASRTPEGRGINKRVLFLAAVVVAIVVGAVVSVFSFGSDSLSAKDAQATNSQESELTNPSVDDTALTLPPTATPQPTATPRPTLTTVPTPTPNPTPTSAPELIETDSQATSPQPTAEPTLQPVSATVPKVYPDIKFGDVLQEGLLELKFQSGELVDAWYSFQVDTKTREITLFFAQYDDALERIVSTVKVDQYTQGADLSSAEVTFYYPDGSSRILFFDGTEGSISLEQQYRLPTAASMFSAGLRRALVFYGMELRDDAGEIEVQLHLDLSGLSQSEGLEFKRLVPGAVDDALGELQSLVEQIEDQSGQS